MQRYFMDISFDGSRYHGWQVQPNGDSVQQQLQRALRLLTGNKSDITVTGAGRTDAGVHARQMIAHFDWADNADTHQLAYRLNRIVPSDIVVNEVYPVGSDMHARFSAKKRTYRYFIHTRRDPFLNKYSVEMPYSLDFKQMNTAASLLLDVKDFKSFCKANNDSKTTLCDLYKAEWVSSSGHEWYFEISANRFLRNMVRAVVGTLVEVGRHRLSLDDFRQVVLSGNRSEAGESMPAKGLFLWSIDY